MTIYFSIVARCFLRLEEQQAKGTEERSRERNRGEEQGEKSRGEEQGKEYGRCRRGAWQETGAKQRERSRGEE